MNKIHTDLESCVKNGQANVFVTDREDKPLINNHIDLHACINSLPANVFVADKDFNLVYMNAHAKKTLKAIEPTIQEVFQLNVDDIQGGSIHRFHRDRRKVEAILRNPSALPYETEIEFGEVILRTVINAVWDETGQLEAYVVSWEDVTESKKLERALNIKLAELNQSNQDLESFATIASHDLMAPVRKIINFAEAMLKNCVHFSENDKFLLNKIINSGKRMRLLMDEILEYSRLAGHSSTFEGVSLNDVLSEVLATLSDQIVETGGKVQFEPLPVIEANKTQMVQLIQNLISNALKYKKKNVPPVVKISSSIEEKGFIKISVEDNGIGIQDEHADLIFKPFERLIPEIEGTGMGLAICKKVVVSHGGEITVKSLANRGGSVFNMKLPERHAK